MCLFEFDGMDDVFKQSWHAKWEVQTIGKWSQWLWATGCDFFGKEGLQSKIAKHGTIFKLELRWNGGQGMKGNQENFHYANRGKVREYYLGAIKDS